MNLRHLAALSAVNEAANLASTELDALMVWILLLRAIAPPEQVKMHPVVELRFHSSEPWLASTRPVGSNWAALTVNSPAASGSRADSWQLESGGSSED